MHFDPSFVIAIFAGVVLTKLRILKVTMYLYIPAYKRKTKQFIPKILMVTCIKDGSEHEWKIQKRPQ